MNCRINSRRLNASVRITFSKLQVKANLSFANLIRSSVSGPKALKTRVCVLPSLQCRRFQRYSSFECSAAILDLQKGRVGGGAERAGKKKKKNSPLPLPPLIFSNSHQLPWHFLPRPKPPLFTKSKMAT